MPTVTPLRSGDPRRIGRYRLIGRLGGVFGADGNPDVFLGRAAEGEQVTVTLLDAQQAADPAARDRFTAEARAARRVDPFCVSRILDAGVAAGRPYLTSEYLEGSSLREVTGGEGPLAAAQLTGLAIGTVTGLAAIHQAGLVHGAFGPDYIVLGPEGPRVVHFSINPPYGAATPAADLHAWALTMLYAAVGRPSVGPQDLPALPELVRGPVSACLAPDPASRPTARAVLSGLLEREDPSAGLLAEGTRQARSAARSAVRPAPRRAGRTAAGNRSRAVMWTTACVACLLAIAGAGWFISARPGRAPAAPARPAAVSGREVPAPLAGTWAGQVHQTAPVLAVTVQLALAAGAPGGTIDYPALGCSGTLRVVTGGGGSVTLAQHITLGRQNCEDGEITLTARGTGELLFSFARSGAPTPSGVLTRARPAPSPSPS